MRKTLSIFLISGTMSAALAMAPAAIPQALATPASHAAVPMHAQRVDHCKDSDYSCGYRHGHQDGFKDARTLCGKPHHHRYSGAYGSLTKSEQGYRDGYSTAFAHYCHV